MAVKIAPDARRQFLNASGVPYSGAKLFYYASGSSTKQNTYTTSVGNVANSNPIVLDSAGRTPYGVWLTAGLTYKEVLAPSTDTDPPGSPIYTEDGISGINDTAGTASQWTASSLTPTYISGTSFSVAGDQTSELHIGRRLQLSVTAGTVYARISNSVYGAVTTVTVVTDSGALDSGLSSFNLSLLTATGHSLPGLSTALLSGIGIAGTSSPTFTGTVVIPTLDLTTALAIADGGTGSTTASAAFTAIKQAASTTATGVGELATDTEAQAGTDATRLVTPDNLGATVLGIGQTWVDVTASRIIGSTYTNSTGRPIQVAASGTINTLNTWLTFLVNGTLVAVSGATYTAGALVSLPAIVVQSGATYAVSVNSGTPTLTFWNELRV